MRFVATFLALTMLATSAYAMGDVTEQPLQEVVSQQEVALSSTQVKCDQDPIGQWEMMNNGCGDRCDSLKPNMSCTDAFEEACNCGPAHCWSGEKCVKNKSYN